MSLENLSPTEIEREVDEFEKAAKSVLNGKLHLKRWQKTSRSYEFGFVVVSNARVEPVVYVPVEGGPHGRFKFDHINAIVSAGWIGD